MLVLVLFLLASVTPAVPAQVVRAGQPGPALEGEQLRFETAAAESMELRPLAAR